MTTIARTSLAPDVNRRAWRLTGILTTQASWLQTLVRLTAGGVLLPHGAQHFLGWFGGFGFTGTLTWMTDSQGFPAPLAAAGILLEFFGPLALVAGIATRPIALALAVFMTVAASTHVANGFFMNWVGAQPAGIEGFEYHILAVVLCLVAAVRGGGAGSVDRALTTRFDRSPQ